MRAASIAAGAHPIDPGTASLRELVQTRANDTIEPWLPSPPFRLDNSYARDLQGFSVPWRPEAAPAPKSLFFNAPLAEELGLDARRAARRSRRRALRRQRGARRRRADRAGLRRPPVRRLLAAARRRPRDAARRGDRPRRPAPRHRAQGLGPDAVLARRRRQGGGRADAARGADRRGDARARHPDHARARGRRHRRAGAARDGAARRGADARRGEPHPRRHVPVLRRARRRRARAPARRVHDRASRPRSRRRAAAASSPARARRRAPGDADRAVDERRLHPRRDEHRQHDDLGRDHRLRPVRLRRGVRPGGGVQLDRQPGPLRVRQPAEHRALEPGAPGRVPAAAARRRRSSRRWPRRCG